MTEVLILCPACKIELHGTPEMAGKRARCQRCGEVFVISIPHLHPQPKTPGLDDTIVDWLAEGDVDESPGAQPTQVTMTMDGTGTTPVQGHPPGRANAPQGETGQLQLKLSETRGARFSFPRERLLEEAFRASMPQCCLGCGVEHDLLVNLVIWHDQVLRQDIPALTHSGIPVKVQAESLMGFDGENLLDRLPKVPHMPAPFDEPMPFFLCAKCSSDEALTTAVHAAGDADAQCELGIRSLFPAAAFLGRHVGTQHEQYKKLIKAARYARLKKKDPWRALPPPVRNRIANWFKCGKDEKFLCYVPDSDRGKAEIGMSGVVVSGERIVYFKYGALRQINLTEEVRLRVEKTHERYQLHLTSANSKDCVLHCEPAGAEAIRRAIRKAGGKYSFLR